MGDGVVLVRRRALGDVVLLGAVTSALPGPTCVVTDPRYVGLVARLRGVTRVVPWGAGRPAGRVVDLQRTAATLGRFPVARRVRKHSIARRLRLLGWGRGRGPVVQAYARACGVVPRPPPWLDLPTPPRNALALIPGAAWPAKAARASILVTVARRWDGPVLVLGGPGEVGLVSDVSAAIPGARPLAEDGFERTVEALASTAVAIGGDTGLMHLAVACGARAVALAGPTHPDDGFLVGPGWTVLQRELPCRPCALHRVERCAVGDRRCGDHPIEEVWRAVRGARCAGSS